MRGVTAERPLRGYAALMGVFGSATALFGLWMRRSGRRLPDAVAPGDLALATIATHKLSRLITKDRVTSPLRAPFTRHVGAGGPGEVEEQPRGGGLRRAIGDLVTCPYCVGVWVASAFAAGLIVAPRPTRWAASVLTMLLGSDVLQVAYRKLETR